MSKELMEAKDLIKAVKTERVSLIEDLQFVRQGYHKLDESLENRGLSMITFDDHGTGRDGIHQDLAPSKEKNKDISVKDLHFKLKEITKNIEEDRVCSSKCPENHASLLSYGQQAGLNRDKVKAKTVTHLQDEVAALQSLFEERLCSMAEDNEILRIRLAVREDEIRETHARWEKASLELTSFLLDGSKSLTDASDQIKFIVGSFPHRNVDVRNHVEMAAKVSLEKEETILILEKSLEDAQQTILQMEQKLDSLKGAAMVLIDLQQLQNAGTAKESVHSITSSDDKINLIEVIEEKLTCKENQITEANKHADASFLAVNSLENHMVTSASADYAEEYSLGNKAQKMTDIMNNFPPECTMVQVELAKLGLQEIESAFNTAFADSELYLSSLQTDFHTTLSLYTEVVQEFVNNIQEMKENCLELNTNSRYVLQVPKSSKKVVEPKILQQIFDELSHINKKMSSTRDCIISIIDMFGCSAADELLVDENGRTANSSTTPFAPLSAESNAPRLDESSSSGCHPSPVLLTDKALGFESAWLIKRLDDNETAMVSLSREFRMVYNAFTKINVQLAALFSDGEVEDQICFIKSPELVSNKCENLSIIGFDQVLLSKLNRVLPPSLLGMQEAQTGCCNTKEFSADENMNHANSFFEQFEEARETMQEADSIINALLKANENSRQLTGMWKQIGVYLLAEKASMTEEIEQLKSSVHLKDGENEMLQDQIHHIFIELANLMTLLEGSFSHMQTDMEQMFEAVYSDGLSMGTDFLSNICSARLSVEEIFASAMEKDFAAFVFLRFIAAEYPKNFRSFDVDVSTTKLQGSLINDLCSNSICMKDNAVEVEEAQTLITARTEAVVVNLVYEDTAVETLELRKVDEENDTLLKGVAPYAASVDLEQAKGKLNMLIDQNAEFNVHSLDLGLKKLEAEEQLLEQREDVRILEREILTTRSSTEKQLLSCLKIFDNDLKSVSEERDELREQVLSLKDRLDKNFALVDENEAIAVVARQELDASRIYAEQKEDEVKILEHSVEELECTINVLEKKVYEMEEEVERHQIIRDSSELEIQALRDRLLTVRIDENSDSENSTSQQLPEVRLSRELQHRTLELHEAHKQIILLEDKIAEQAKEIKKCKKNITELVLHAEAQSSQYHHKYKMLEAMVREVKTDSSNLASSSATLGKMDKSSIRSRGSSSPFRCIGGFVQQKNSEKYQELSSARLRIEELEALLAGRQKEVCMLNIRLASAESMTHDVIRDLLRVKVDMTDYANLMEQYQLQKSAEEAQQRTRQSIAMEREILNLKKQINELLEERHICILEVNRREAVICSIQMTVEQLQEREQLLTSQNEVLKFDKNNLQRRVAALDDMVKKIFGTHTSQPRVQQQIDSLLSSRNTDDSKRLSNSGKQLLHGDDELPQYYKSDGNHRIAELERYGSEKMFRKHKV